jgi:hypothetical protein
MVWRCCPQCGSDIDSEKDTSSGREVWLHKCLKCDWSDVEDRCIALWQAYSQMNEGNHSEPND